MSDPTKPVDARVAELQKQVTTLRAENELLRSNLGSTAWRIDANKAEAFVHELVGGTRSRGSAEYDLTAPNGKKIEVKFSNVNTPVAGKLIRRWVWARILGRGDQKQFDNLILVAPHDPRFRQDAKDPESPWVIFDVPFKHVHSLVERDGTIWMNTHPTKFRRITHERLIREFQTARNELTSRYRAAH
jgi:hypothetical protein